MRKLLSLLLLLAALPLAAQTSEVDSLIDIHHVEIVGRRPMKQIGVQQTLLKIIEGTVCRIPPKGGRKHPDQEYIEVDTSNILFICGGAFVGLDKIVQERSGRSVIGFGKKGEEGKSGGVDSEINPRDVRPEDLMRFGLIPEFTGRLPVITTMKDLSEEDLVRILTEPKNSLVKQYRKLLSMDGVDLEYVLNSVNIKENIIVKEKKDSYTYTFTLDLGNLTATLQEDGSIRIPEALRPYMGGVEKLVPKK